MNNTKAKKIRTRVFGKNFGAERELKYKEYAVGGETTERGFLIKSAYENILYKQYRTEKKKYKGTPRNERSKF